MKSALSSLAILIVIAGCASSSKKSNKPVSFDNLVNLQKPTDYPYESSKVYVDSVRKISRDNRQALLISGTFPDACTRLEAVTHGIQNDSLYLQFKAWRNPELICAQVLTPFNYIYDGVSQKELNNHSQVFINDSAYNY